MFIDAGCHRCGGNKKDTARNKLLYFSLAARRETWHQLFAGAGLSIRGRFAEGQGATLQNR